VGRSDPFATATAHVKQPWLTMNTLFCYCVALSSLFLTALVSGCATPARYATVTTNRPAAPLNLSGSKDPLATRLDTVIVRNGPGSWKQEAFFDEYVLSFSNQHRSPVTVHTVRLISAQGETLHPGERWWHLESESRACYSQQGFGQDLLIGAQSAASTLGNIAAPVVYTAVYGAPDSRAALASLSIPVMMQVPKISADEAANEVTAEFDCRRIHFPATIAPGSRLNRSVFFPISPAPRKLVVGFEVNGEIREVVVDLETLAGYHANNGLGSDPIPTPIAPLTPPPII
jgi:hypothetical protein